MSPISPRVPLRPLSSSCILPTTIRAFTTTARLDVDIPPESPRFINLPYLPQSSETKLPPLKGVLPVPREIFHRRNKGASKLQPDFMQRTAPKSRAELSGEAPRSETQAWKRMMAESRRAALASGIEALWKRKKTREGQAGYRAEKHRQRNLEAANAPERLDDVLTRGTVTLATLETKVIRDPHHKERQLESQARTAALAKAKSYARRDALQRLYVEAGDFIVDEAELARRVETIFAEDYLRKNSKYHPKPESVWHTYGPPRSTRSMFASLKGTTWRAVDYHDSEASATTRRLKIVAGELTGGAVSASASRVRNKQEH